MAVVTTLLVAGYVTLTLRSVAPASQTTARTVAAVAAVAWYLLTFRIAQRMAFEWLKSMPLAGQTSLSIYSDGRVVVRRTLPQALPKGRTNLALKLEGFDPATLFSPDTSVAVLSALLRPPTDRQAALQRAVGQTLSFVRQRTGGGVDTVRASVVRTEPPQYRLPDGRLLLAEPGEPLFPAELVRTAPEVALVLDAVRDRPRTELAYVTEGTTWEALYQVVIGGGGSGSVTGSATLRSQSVRADSAERRCRGSSRSARSR